MMIKRQMCAGLIGSALLCATFPRLAAQTNTVLLTPQDTSLKLDAANYSAGTVLTTYTWPNNKIANAIVLKFNLSSIPANAVVTDASLQLSLVGSDGALGTYAVSAHKLLGKNPDITRATGYTADGVTAWTPNGCCYQNVPLAQADISPAYAQKAIDILPGLKTWTLTSMVQEWLANPATNFGVLLNGDPSKRRDRYRSFASMEHPNTGLRPVLRVSFTTTSGGGGTGGTLVPGDLLVSLETGPVQWRRASGAFVRTLPSTVAGTGEGMGFDPGGNPYVTRWCSNDSCTNGNAVEMFNVRGESQGTFGSDYNCGPHAIVFDAAGTAYVGLAGCTGAIVKLVQGQPPAYMAVAPDNEGAFWIDLAADGCTIFYTSWGPNVKRFNGCTRVQRPNFNVAPLPGGGTQDLRVLPDGGVVVASGDVVARLNASGALVQTYSVSGQVALWSGLDLVGDGTFWAGNYETSNVYRFDLATGAVVSSFNTGTSPHTVVGIRVVK